MSNSEIEINVRTLTNGEHTFRTSKTAPSVLSFIASSMESSTGVPVARQRLLHSGKALPDGSTHTESASELGWGDMAQITLHMVDTDEGASRPDPRAEGNVLHGLFRTLTGGDHRDPVKALQEVAAAFGASNGSVIMDFVEGFLADLTASVRNGLEAAAAQLRSEASTEAMAPSVELVNEMIAKAMPEIVARMRAAMKDHLSFVEKNRTADAREAAAASAAEAAATNVVPNVGALAAGPDASTTGAHEATATTTTTKSAKPSLPPKKKPAPGGLGLGGGLKKKPAAAKAAGTSSAVAKQPAAPANAANPMQQMMSMLGGGAGGAGGAAGANPLGGLLGGLMGGRPQQPEAPLDVDEVLATEIQADEERIMWKKTVEQMESMAAARGSNGAPELPPLGEVYLASIPDTKGGGSALDQIFDL